MWNERGWRMEEERPVWRRYVEAVLRAIVFCLALPIYLIVTFPRWCWHHLLYPFFRWIGRSLGVIGRWCWRWCIIIPIRWAWNHLITAPVKWVWKRIVIPISHWFSQVSLDVASSDRFSADAILLHHCGASQLAIVDAGVDCKGVVAVRIGCSAVMDLAQVHRSPDSLAV
jgi:hypothetical protein